MLESRPSGAIKDRPLTRQIEQYLLVGILVLGCLLRLGHLWAIWDTAFLKTPLFLVGANSDQYAFWQWAHTILAGDLLGRNTYHPFNSWMKAIAPLETWYRWWGGKQIFQQAPFYPYWVAGLRALSWNSLRFVILVQLLVGALQPLIMFWLAKRLFDARAGLVAAALTAFYGPFIFHQGTLLRDWLPPILEPLALVALLRARETGRGAHWLVAGGILGTALLTKEGVLLFVPLALLWLFLEYRPSVRQAGASAATLLLGFLLALSPLMIRNGIVGAPLFAISNRAAEGFIIGNAADAVGTFIPKTLGKILARSNGRLLPTIQETLGTYHGDWAGFVDQQVFKFRGLVDPFEVPNNVSFSYGLEISPALWFTLRYGIIFPLGVAGFVLSLRTWRRHRLLWLYGLSTVGGLMAANILARYRLALVPVLVVYGAAGVVSVFEMVRSRRTAKIKLYLLLVAGVAVAQHVLVPSRLLQDAPDHSIHSFDYLVSADIYASEGRLDRAVAEMERLQEKAGERPSLASIVADARFLEGNYRAQWAEHLIKEGKWEEARRQAELAEAAYKHLNLSAPNSVLGGLYLALGEPARARGFYERFLALGPDGSKADEVRRILSRLDDSPK